MASKGKGTPGWLIVCYIVGMLLTGTLNTLCTKIQFTLSSVGINGQTELFHKPWFATLNMLFAMGLVGVIDKLVRMSCGGGKGDKETPLMIDEAPGSKAGNGNGNAQTPYRKKVMLVAYPAAFDIVATALCAVGMLYIPASVWQMLRGSSIVFACIFSILFLNRKMYVFNWLGLGLCVIGVCMVGIASVMGDKGSSSSDGDEAGPEGMLIGMSLVLLGQVVQAAQIIAEEFLMKSVDLPPMQIIGLEGFWGTLIMMVIVYPILWVMPGSDGGHQEDPFDTFAMLSNNQTLLSVVLLFLFSCGTFNATGIAVTASLSGVHRMMLDASRTVMIWGFGLWVHYRVDHNSPYGEVWTQYSYLQLVGFVVLVSGQAVYSEVLKVPGLTYPPPMVPSPSPTAALNLCSPLPREAVN